jgi:predicted adenine nucleotide alpha hydrolase (AANH) superfamily ATPase
MNDKVTIIVKPTQSGKTFQMLLGILSIFRAAPDDVRRIQLIFVDNNLILANQTASRVSECEWFEDEENEYLMFSSKSKTSDAAKIYWEMTNPSREKQVSNIIMCANNTRFKDTEELISRTAVINPNIFFDLWIDESDKTFSTPKHTSLLHKLCQMNNVKTVTLLTATPGSNFRQFGEINIVPMESTIVKDTYSAWTDININKIDATSSDTVKYAETVINNHPEKFVSGVRCFIPSDVFIDTHEEMAEMLVNKGFSVLLINGVSCDVLFKIGNKKKQQLVRQGVAITLCGFNPEKYKNGLNNIQASEWIADIYEALMLSKFPFAITGNICIGRGTTLSSSKMCINRAIFPPKEPKNRSSKELSLARMYQLAGRINGNTKEFASWETPIVFCTPMFDDCIKTMETRAKRLAEVAHDSGNTIVDQKAYETIADSPMTANEIKQKNLDEELELKGTVPVVINIGYDNMQKILNAKAPGKSRSETLLGILSGINFNLWIDILTYDCIKVSEPGKRECEEARKKYIDGSVNKATNGIKWKMDISKNDNDKDVWLALLDVDRERIIISVWHGSRVRQLK